MTKEEIFDFAKTSDMKMLKALIPFLRGFAIFYRDDGTVAEHIGTIPRSFPRDLSSIQSYLVSHPAFEAPTASEIAVGEFDRFIVHLLDGQAIGFHPKSVLLIAMPSDLHVDRLLSALPTGIIKLDNFWQASYCNEYAEVLLGMGNDEILGRGWLQAIDEEIVAQTVEYFKDSRHFGSPFKTETELISPMGVKRHLAIQISVALNFDHSINEYYIVFQDTTSEHAATKKAKFLANHDSLTGLKNRSYLLQDIERTIKDHRIRESALIYIDLNDFKMVNDTYGHEAGDQVLKVAAKRLGNAVRDQDVVARIGGDEFVLFLKSVTEEALLKTVAAKIQGALNQPISLDNNVTIDLVSSFGLSHGAAISFIMDDQQEINIDNWLRSADIAMYTSKEKHDGSYEIFDESFHQTKLAEKNQFQKIKGMVDDDLVIMFFQPIIKNEQVESVEVLARFFANDLLLGPEEVIDLAGKYNYQMTLFHYLLVSGFRAYKSLLARLGSDVRHPCLNINVDLNMLCQLEFPDICKQLTDEMQLDCTMIYLEITEKVLESDVTIIQTNIEKLKTLGFNLSMDDFGTGYNSIRRLMEYKFDQLKIDRSLISGATHGSQLHLVLEAAVKLGEALTLDILAEGVETSEELHVVKQLDIELFQGYYFSKPQSSDITLDLINSRNQLKSNTNSGR